jgi:hypothetical protein
VWFVPQVKLAISLQSAHSTDFTMAELAKIVKKADPCEENGVKYFRYTQLKDMGLSAKNMLMAVSSMRDVGIKGFKGLEEEV